MRLMDMYSSMQNPLDDLEVLRKIALAYATSGAILHPLYEKLICSNQSEKKLVGEYHIKEADRFYSLIFNLWKKEIATMSKEKANELFVRREVEESFVDLHNFLHEVPDLFTKEEIDGFFDNPKHSKERKAYLERYRWDRLEKNSDWIHVWSYYIHFSGDFKEIKHRLYINTESIDTYPFITHFIEECENEGLLYYFKFDAYGDRDDTIVIYSSTEHLSRYIEVLRRMKVKYPDLFERIKSPSILTGKIDEKIGYGASPKELLHGRKTSFNEIRAELLEKVCQEESIKWILKNKERTINSVPLIEILIFTCTLEFLEYLKRKVEAAEKYEIRTAKKQNRKVQKENIIKSLGYGRKDIASPILQQSLYEIIRSRILGLLDYVSKNGFVSMPEIDMNIRGKKLSFTRFSLEKAIKQTIKSYALNDVDFLYQIKEAAKQKAGTYNIDANKFCCEASSIEEYKRYDAHGPMSRKRISNIDQTANQP